ncbi:hypothetical protein ACF1BQ_039110 [Bradyrhizobium sp. RDT10]
MKRNIFSEGTGQLLLICPSCQWSHPASGSLHLRFRQISRQQSLEIARMGLNAEQPSLSDRLWYPVEIPQQWRIVLRWTDAGPEDVEMIDYH